MCPVRWEAIQSSSSLWWTNQEWRLEWFLVPCSVAFLTAAVIALSLPIRLVQASPASLQCCCACTSRPPAT
jgi:hypothetical protein